MHQARITRVLTTTAYIGPHAGWCFIVTVSNLLHPPAWLTPLCWHADRLRRWDVKGRDRVAVRPADGEVPAVPHHLQPLLQRPCPAARRARHPCGRWASPAPTGMHARALTRRLHAVSECSMQARRCSVGWCLHHAGDSLIPSCSMQARRRSQQLGGCAMQVTT